MLSNISDVQSLFIVCGYTDIRKSIDGLIAIIKDAYDLNPFENTLFYSVPDLVIGLRLNGFLLMYKRLEDGRFQWSRSKEEIRGISWQEFR